MLLENRLADSIKFSSFNRLGVTRRSGTVAVNCQASGEPLILIASPPSAIRLEAICRETSFSVWLNLFPGVGYDLDLRLRPVQILLITLSWEPIYSRYIWILANFLLVDLRGRHVDVIPWVSSRCVITTNAWSLLTWIWSYQEAFSATALIHRWSDLLAALAVPLQHKTQAHIGRSKTRSTTTVSGL